MPAPLLVLVDPRAQRRSAIRQRSASIGVGVVIALACAIPYVLTLPH
ncbi:hypothetical protein [uncultured Amnibacterium sp.]